MRVFGGPAKPSIGQFTQTAQMQSVWSFMPNRLLAGRRLSFGVRLKVLMELPYSFPTAIELSCQNSTQGTTSPCRFRMHADVLQAPQITKQPPCRYSCCDECS